MKPLNRKVAAIALVVIVTASALSISYFLLANSNKGVTVIEGAFLLSASSNHATIKVLSPNASVSVKDFSGRITFENCFPGCAVKGYTGQIERSGTTISINISASRTEIDLVAEQNRTFSFAVVGDSQGMNNIFEKLITEMDGVDFAVHCGDTTPSGSPSEFASFKNALNTSSFPFFVTAGNHDVQSNGIAAYTAELGPPQYSFTYAGVTFALVDSSSQSITQSQINWLKTVFAGAQRKVIITHVPSYDPIEGNHTLDNASCARIREFAAQNGVDYVFSGHIHAFNESEVNGVNYVITGGGGGHLISGSYHFVRVNITPTSISLKKIDLEGSIGGVPSALSIIGKSGTVNVTLSDLLAMEQIGSNSSYQNQLNNYQGYGYYKGVLVSDLVELVGGMGPNDNLTVSSTDGYTQTFGYMNVYPNATWQSYQGGMIIAIQFDSLAIPSWGDGPRIAFLPADGQYSNSDCQHTSYPNQGYNLYASAGARWSKNVASISVGG